MAANPRARIVVCVPATFPALFRDDVLGACVLCTQAIRFRPHVDDRRCLVCLICYFKHAQHGTTCELQQESIQELCDLSIDQIQAIAESHIDQLRALVLESMPVKGSTC